MKWQSFRLLTVIAAWLPVTSVRGESPTRPPNIVFILADDLGYADVGAFGQTRIHTPNIDKLAAEGIKLTTHYAGNAVCAPSRCVLLSGKHPGHAFVRNNKEIQPEGQQPVPESELALPLTLKRLGYATGDFGKWGLGPVHSEGDPLKQGFDQFFGYNCQRAAHNYYPKFLYDNDTRVALDNPDPSLRPRLAPSADPNDPKSYDPFQGKQYSADVISDRAEQFIRDHQSQPFFLYFSTTLPHVSLQVPSTELSAYEGQFDDKPADGQGDYVPVRQPRATYAAMISHLDHEVGRIVEEVHSLGLDDNTILIFTSDNGPVGPAAKYFQSAGIFRAGKGTLYEGGVREPCIVRWKGKIAAGTSNDRVTGFEDWLPTLLDLSGAHDAIPAGLDGSSVAPTLRGQAQLPRGFLYREFSNGPGAQSVRVENWKLIRHGPAADAPAGSPPTVELYDLGTDPSETNDRSSENSAKVRELVALLDQQHVKSDLFPLKLIDGH